VPPPIDWIQREVTFESPSTLRLRGNDEKEAWTPAPGNSSALPPGGDFA